MEVSYTPGFVRQFKKLSTDLQDEIIEKISLFKQTKNHRQLKVHALSGKFLGYHSFSVNFAYRIIFEYVTKTNVALIKTGDHDIYNEK